MKGCTPLVEASFRGRAPIVKALLEAGARAEAQDCDVSFIKYFACIHNGGAHKDSYCLMIRNICYALIIDANFFVCSFAILII